MNDDYEYDYDFEEELDTSPIQRPPEPSGCGPWTAAIIFIGVLTYIYTPLLGALLGILLFAGIYYTILNILDTVNPPD